jgi:hypothetical protein
VVEVVMTRDRTNSKLPIIVFSREPLLNRRKINLKPN